MASMYSAFLWWPGLAAVVSGYFLDDWRLAGAVTALALGATVLLLWLQPPFGVFALPFAAGATIGAGALTGYLRLRGETTIWDRMLVALIAALLAGAALLFGR